MCFVRDQDAGGAYLKTYLKKENIIVYDEHYIHTWPKHPYDYLVEIVKNKKWDKLSIGLEMDAHYFTAFCYQKIRDGLPDAKIKDSERLEKELGKPVITSNQSLIWDTLESIDMNKNILGFGKLFNLDQ